MQSNIFEGGVSKSLRVATIVGSVAQPARFVEFATHLWIVKASESDNVLP